MRWLVLIIFSLLGGIGVTFLCVSFFIERNIKNTIESCQNVTGGRIVDLIHETVGSNRPGEADIKSWFPVYEYSVGGKVYRIKSSVGTSDPKHKVGDEVPIHYNAVNPEEIYIEANEYSIIILVFRIVGIVLIVLSILLFAARVFLM